MHLAKNILSDLRTVQDHWGTDQVEKDVRKLLAAMRTMRDIAPYDPYLEVVMALYDALAGERWRKCTPDQMQGAYDILARLAYERIDDDKVGKAIGSLGKLGFDCLPYRI